MNYSEDANKDIELAIQRVKQFTTNDKIIVSVQGFLNFIPCAGGTLSHILSVYREKRTIERIFKALNKLKEAIERLPEEKKKILSEDEIIEIVKYALEDIANTSSKEKLEYLHNSLIKAFTKEEVSYSQKQFYLSTLRNFSLGELELLKEIYLSSDPFVEIYPKRKQSNSISSPLYFERKNVFYPPPQYLVQYKEPQSGETLKEMLQLGLKHLSLGTLEGLIESLDGKGLTKIGPNLNSRTQKIMTETFRDPIERELEQIEINKTASWSYQSAPQKTPYEASRTEFGIDFIKYIQSEK